MLYVIAGPSGAGKTTFIKSMQKTHKTLKVIQVDVYSVNSRVYEVGFGRNVVSRDCYEKIRKMEIIQACVVILIISMGSLYLKTVIRKII